MKQICIYPKEVTIILVKSQSHAQTLFRIMKDVYNKKKHQVVTIREFCEYMALPFDGGFAINSSTNFLSILLMCLSDKIHNYYFLYYKSYK